MKISNFNLKSTLLFTLLGLSATAYIALGYFTSREQFSQLLLLFILAFVLGGALIKYFGHSYKLITFASIIFRVILLFSIPSLTDDFYRFFWDGTLSTNGINPFLYMPSEYIKESVLVPEISYSLFEKLNSPDYFTVYPPVCQFMFWVGSTLGNGLSQSVLIMKSFVVLAEIGSLFLIGKLLKLFNLKPKNILLYALNPLVIMELSGNLHFEAVMIFFLLLAVFLFKTGRLKLSATSIALATAVKLLPLIFLPLLIRRFKIRELATYVGIIGAILTLLFYPFYDREMIANLWSSIDLYFQTFEFNASAYYLVRAIGYYITGYNNIAIIGPLLSGVILIMVLIISYRKESDSGSKLFASMLLSITAYFLLSTTVHPWYITSLVALAVFTNYKYSYAWSFLVLMSYAAYAANPFQENFYLLGLEYLPLMGLMCYELFRSFNRTAIQQQPPPS